MKLQATADLVYVFEPDTEVMALLPAARSPDQSVLSERLSLDPGAILTEETGIEGERMLRGRLGGQVAISYAVEVDNGRRELLPARGRQHSWSELPANVLPYLLPSRFCPSDQFQRFAGREFGAAGDGVARVMAVLDWIAEHVDYVSGVSDAATTAEHTFMVRAGVCRDFTHLGISFCRALSIPARAVSAYALGVQPPDFHAVMEVWLENRWWLVDPTRLAPVEGMIRIVQGRDAADIAFLSTDKPCRLISQSVAVARLAEAGS